MSQPSPYLLTKALETQIGGILMPIDVIDLDQVARKLVVGMKRGIIDARLDARDYELSETREEQLKNAKAAKKRLKQLEHDILAASEYNIFSSIDVAQLTANLEQIIERLE